MRAIVTKDARDQISRILLSAKGNFKDEKVLFGWCFSLNNTTIVGNMPGINAYYLKDCLNDNLETKWIIHLNDNNVIEVYQKNTDWLYKDNKFLNIESLLSYLQKEYSVIDMYPINNKYSVTNDVCITCK